jgi:hypothetical protein
MEDGRMNIYDFYTPEQLRQEFLEGKDNGGNGWAEDFQHWVNMEIADELLNNYLSNISEREYIERVREIVEDYTYGYEDEDGKEMLEFNP